MPASSRLQDNCTGHGCWPPRPNNSASTNVFVNNKPMAIIGDAVACGSLIRDGSSNVFAND